jgi:regulator of cell morphogenesis and NO signaling
MTFDETKTVREFALSIPSATKVFEKLGIDYCCGGGKKLGEACVQAKLPVEQVLQQLKQAESSRQALNESGPDWSGQPLADLIDHIVKKHHAFIYEETPRLTALADKVASKHGANHPETAKVNELVEGLFDELSMHLMKEEQILFPYIIRMEEAVIEKAPVLPPPFGTVQNPIRMMVSEHDSAGNILRELRAITGDYNAPEDACTSYRTLYNGLLELEADLHQHIHLENNVLFPRAVAMEDAR